MSSSKCSVCSETAFFKSYGVVSCLPCASFFRRSLLASFPRLCENEQKCVNSSVDRKKKSRKVMNGCRFCRFLKCLSVGMSFDPSSNLQFQSGAKFEFLVRTLQKLSDLNAERNANFDKNQVGNRTKISLEDVIKAKNSTTFTKKTDDFSFYDWGFQAQVTTIDFMKRFEFVAFLGEEDVMAFVKASYFKCSIFATAMRSATKGRMTFPDDVDIFPEDTQKMCASGKFLEMVRCLLVARMRELKVSHPEFLLLSAFLVCNPTVSDLSPQAQKLIGGSKSTFGDALLAHCFLVHQQKAPSRFAELLSLCHVIGATVEHLKTFTLHFQLFQPGSEEKLKRLFVGNDRI